MTDIEEHRLKDFGIEIFEYKRGATGAYTILVATLGGIAGGVLSEIGKEVWVALKNYLIKRMGLGNKGGTYKDDEKNRVHYGVIRGEVDNVPVVYYLNSNQEKRSIDFDMNSIAAAEAEIRLLIETGKIETHRFLGIKLDTVGKGPYLHEFKGLSSNDLFAIIVEDASAPKIEVADHMVAGNWFNEIGRFDLAEKHFQIAADAFPNDPRIYVNLGIAQDRQGKFQQCVKSWQKSAELDKRYDKFHYNLACHYGENSDAANAAKELKLAYEHGWRDVHVLLNDPGLSPVLDDHRVQEVIQKIRGK